MEEEYLRDRETYSEEILHIYDGYTGENVDDRFRRESHNSLVINTIKKLEEANRIADQVNEDWMPKYQKMIFAKKIQEGFFVIFGLSIIFFGILIAPQDNGTVLLNAEIIGIILAGIGIFLTALYSLISWNDDIYQRIIVLLSNENHIFAEFSAIQSQLSYIINEVIDAKKTIK
jgi:hypothetical protein